VVIRDELLNCVASALQVVRETLPFFSEFLHSFSNFYSIKGCLSQLLVFLGEVAVDALESMDMLRQVLYHLVGSVELCSKSFLLLLKRALLPSQKSAHHGLLVIVTS